MNAYTNLPNLDIESQETNQATQQGALDRSTIDMDNLPMNVSVEDEDRIDVDIALSDQFEKYNGKLRCIKFMKLMICLCLIYVVFLFGFALYVIIRMNIESGRHIMTDGSQGLVTEEVPEYTIREPTARLPGTSTSYSLPFAAMVGNLGCDNCVRDFGESYEKERERYEKERKKIQEEKDEILNYFMCWVLCCIFIKVLCCSERR